MQPAPHSCQTAYDVNDDYDFILYHYSQSHHLNPLFLHLQDSFSFPPIVQPLFHLAKCTWSLSLLSRYAEAVRLLKSLLETFTCDSRRGYWTLRLSVDLEHMGYLNESLSLAEQGVQDPWIRAGSKMALQRRVIRLGKPPRRWKMPSFATSVNQKIKEVHVVGRPLNCEQGMKNRFYGEDEGQCSVEQLALQYYAGEGGGWQGVHTESGIWMTIFGLLMWDVIFADIPDVFLTRFQVKEFGKFSSRHFASVLELKSISLLWLRAGHAHSTFCLHSCILH